MDVAVLSGAKLDGLFPMLPLSQPKSSPTKRNKLKRKREPETAEEPDQKKRARTPANSSPVGVSRKRSLRRKEQPTVERIDAPATVLFPTAANEESGVKGSQVKFCPVTLEQIPGIRPCRVPDFSRVEHIRTRRLAPLRTQSESRFEVCIGPKVDDFVLIEQLEAQMKEHQALRDWDVVGYQTILQGHVTVGEIVGDHPAKAFSESQKEYGLFAVRDLPKHTVLGTYCGVYDTVCAYQAAASPDNEHLKVNSWDLASTAEWDNDALTVDAEVARNELSYANDCRPDVDAMDAAGDFTLNDTCKSRMNTDAVEVMVDGWPYIFFVTVKDVPKGEELLIDYGKDYWTRSFEIKGSRRFWLDKLSERDKAIVDLKEENARLRRDLEAKTKEVEVLRSQLG